MRLYSFLFGTLTFIILNASLLTAQTTSTADLNTSATTDIRHFPDEKASQNGNRRVQSVYLELFGNSITYALNYDTRFTESDKGIGGRVGLSGFAVAGQSVFTAPLMVNYLLGENGKYLELGIGGTLYSANVDFLFAEPRQSVIGTMTFGYRKQPVDGGMLFKASITPVFGSFTKNFFFIPYYASISIGYAFTSKQAF